MLQTIVNQDFKFGVSSNVDSTVYVGPGTAQIGAVGGGLLVMSYRGGSMSFKGMTNFESQSNVYQYSILALENSSNAALDLTAVPSGTATDLKSISFPYLGPQPTENLTTIPSAFTVLDSTSQLYDSSVYSDIPGLFCDCTVQTNNSFIFSTLTLQTDSSADQTTAGNITGGYKILIDSTSGSEFHTSTETLETNTISFRNGPFSKGVYTIKGQANRADATDSIDGTRYFRVNRGTLFSESLEGGTGAIGPLDVNLRPLGLFLFYTDGTQISLLSSSKVM